jgi:predicted transposase YdaD
MHVFSFTEHAIGAPDVAVSFELQANPEGQEGSQEVEVQQVGPEEPEEEVECPSHEPASFVKGKPRSILSPPLLLKVYLICYIYCCIKYRSCDETFAAFYSILVQISFHYLVIELGSSSSLAML